MATLRNLLIMLFVLGIFESAFAQNKIQMTIDSLASVLARTEIDTDKVNILYKLAAISIGSSPENSITYGEQALKLSEDTKWEPGIAKSTILLGVVYRRKAEYEKSLNYFSRSLKSYTSLHDKLGEASCMLNIANVYSDKGNKTIALEYYYKSMAIYEEVGSKDDVSALLSNIGLLYADNGDETKALEIYLQALKLREETGNINGLGILLGNIANIYSGKKNYPIALNYYLRALQASRKTGDMHNEGLVLGNIGNLYTMRGQVMLGIKYLEEAIRLNEQMSDDYFLASNLQYLGKAYITLAKNEDNGHVTNNSNAVSSRPSPTDRASKLKYAITFLKKGIEISKTIGGTDALQNCYGDIANAYRLLGDYKRSLEYQDSFYVIRDSTYSKDNKIIMANLATKREEDLKKKQIAINQLAMRKKKDEQLYFSIGSGLLLVILLGLFFSRKTIQKEKNISEKLLLNILPAEVAEELKKKGESDAKHFDDVTVLFTDFVGFTTVSEKLTPKQLVDELHACFTAFDTIMTKYNIEKIKTVGDAYLAVSGLPSANKKHAENIVRAAMDIRNFMLERHQQLGERTFSVRIGINSGNVVAGIVGVKKFAYDIWGDTVNTAARMEQNGEPGKINISQSTYDLIKDQFECTFRGQISAKNKGQLDMYFVKGLLHKRQPEELMLNA